MRGVKDTRVFLGVQQQQSCFADVDELLQEDLRRLQQRKQESATTSNLGGDNDEKAPLQDIIDKALIADFFFILFALAWLGVGVGVKSSSGNTVCTVLFSCHMHGGLGDF